ncbi:hypothetical protein RI129_013058 [Pyrocoelia pectoralis]|uniref:Endonuclease/exonuclease/phosphatase domain-containing protein n=1 Tax=Pyrocoelia pectoralis TaxID=417401 RepID=A0AAN7V3W6_9COLE
MKIICAYAPTEDTSEIEKKTFYEELETLCEKREKKDLLVLMGDFNAKIGREAKWREDIRYTRKIGNGNKLCNMAVRLNMNICSTRY